MSADADRNTSSASAVHDAYAIRDGFGLEHLRRAPRQTPQPGGTQVLLRVGAASLNYRDWLMVAGQYNPRQKLPLVPLSDAAGTVQAVGDRVTRFKPGDRAISCFFQDWIDGPWTKARAASTLGGPLDGVLAEYVLLDEQGLVPTPGHLSDAEAATLPVAALTAWWALFEDAKLTPGQTVLVQGTGGVSLFALQMASRAGARVIVTSSSDEKLHRALQLADDGITGINYRSTPDWDKAARDLTGGEGVDVVIEVGGAGTLPRSIQAVKPEGVIHIIGNLSGRVSELDVAPVLHRRVRLHGVFVGPRRSFEAMNAALQRWQLRPVIDRVFPFEEAPQALEHLSRGAHFGKVVIGITDSQ